MSITPRGRNSANVGKQVGNSALGTTPALLANGIPDKAFTPIEGDVKSRCTELKRENKRERQEYKTGQGYLFDPPHKLGNLAAEFAKIDAAGEDTPTAIAAKERRYAELIKGQAYQFGRLLAARGAGYFPAEYTSDCAFLEGIRGWGCRWRGRRSESQVRYGDGTLTRWALPD